MRCGGGRYLKPDPATTCSPATLSLLSCCNRRESHMVGKDRLASRDWFLAILAHCCRHCSHCFPASRLLPYHSLASHSFLSVHAYIRILSGSFPSRVSFSLSLPYHSSFPISQDLDHEAFRGRLEIFVERQEALRDGETALGTLRSLGQPAAVCLLHVSGYM